MIGKMLVGMVIPDQTNPYFSELSFHMQSHLSQLGIPLVVLCSDGSVQLEYQCVQTLSALQVSGIVFVSAGDDVNMHGELRRLGKPHIIFDRELPETENCDFVISDNSTGVRLAVEHLVERGHRSLAFIKGCQNTDPGRARLLAFRDIVRQQGIGGLGNEYIYEYEGQFDYLSGYLAAESILKLEESMRPSAVVASNDLSAIGALQKFHEKGIKVPGDISIIGFDDIVMCQWVYPKLTTIRQEVIELTRFAAHLLLSRLSNEYTAEPRVRSVAPRLIERESILDLKLSAAKSMS